MQLTLRRDRDLEKVALRTRLSATTLAFIKQEGTGEKTDLSQTKQEHLESVQRFNNPVYSLKLSPVVTAEG